MERYRIVEGVGLYYVTFSVVEWLPVFIDESACKIITDSFNFCIKNKCLAVNAYVIMPTHLHATLFDVEFNPQRLKSTLDDTPPDLPSKSWFGAGVRKFTERQLLDQTEGLQLICQNHLRQNFKPMRGRIENNASGKPGNVRWASLRTVFGNRNWITSMKIPAEKDWCETLKTGGFLRHDFG